jgi:hypothetical protein
LEDATKYVVLMSGLKDIQVVKYSRAVTLRSILTGINQKNDVSAVNLLQQIIPKWSSEPRLLYLFQT